MSPVMLGAGEGLPERTFLSRGVSRLKMSSDGTVRGGRGTVRKSCGCSFFIAFFFLFSQKEKEIMGSRVRLRRRR